MDYWPWWVSGLALSAVMVLHWLLLHRMMAVSGRITSLIDRVRHGPTEPRVQLSPEEMIAAIQAATAAEFGHAPESAEAEVTESHAPVVPVEPVPGATQTLPGPPPRTPAQHFLFFLGLILGGTVSTLVAGDVAPTLTLQSETFARLSGEAPLASYALLGVGGLLVGFGTRMSGGCTSGHGLCGTSRLQPGSLLATLSFFGVGILFSFGLRAVL